MILKRQILIESIEIQLKDDFETNFKLKFNHVFSFYTVTITSFSKDNLWF